MEKKYFLFLHGDGTFHYEERTFNSVSSGGFTLPSKETRSGEEVPGRWSCWRGNRLWCFDRMAP
jgi:hypothetical protein